MPVDDYNLSVVAVVDFAGEVGEADLQKGIGLDAGVPHFAEKGLFQLPAAYVVYNQADFYALGGLAFEQGFYFSTDFVVGKDVVFEVDELFGGLECFQNGLKSGAPILEDLKLVAYGNYRVAVVEQQLDEGPLFFKRLIVEYLPLRQAVNLGVGQIGEQVHIAQSLAGNDFFLAKILSEEDEKDEAEYRQHQEYQDPGYGFQRIAVFEHGENHHHQNADDVGGQQQGVDNVDYGLQAIHGQI